MFRVDHEGGYRSAIAERRHRRRCDRRTTYLGRRRAVLRIVTQSGVMPTTVHQLVQPKREPWYATLMLQADCDEQLYLGDLCRHLAWGWVNHRRRRAKQAMAAAELRRKLELSLLDSYRTARNRPR